MKCGLICARSARTSASISRVRDASSSASSSWAETQPGHLVRRAHQTGARRSAPYAARLPTTRSSTMSGATTATLIGQSGSAQATSRGAEHLGAPAARSRAACVDGASRCVASPAPSQASSVLAVGDRDGRGAEQLAQVRAARLAPAAVSPARSGGAASDGGVQGVERRPVGVACRSSAGCGRPQQRHGERDQRQDHDGPRRPLQECRSRRRP